MKRVLKWTLYVVAGLAVAIGVAAAVLTQLAERKMAREVNVDVKAIEVPSGAAALAQGRYLFESRGCSQCHGADGKGRVVIDAPNGMFVRAPSITPGGVVARYSVEDWVRVVRHGLKPDRRPVIIMPSEDYNRLTDADTGALIAYVKSLPATPGTPAELRLPFIVKALYGAGIVRDAAQIIDHTLPPPAPVPVGATAEHGKYVANLCIGCHGAMLSGGKIPGGPPEWSPASNLTPGEGTVMARYDSADKLRAMFRSGKRPDGSAVNTVMPFETLAALNDTDVAALHAYLKTVPPRAAGSR